MFALIVFVFLCLSLSLFCKWIPAYAGMTRGRGPLRVLESSRFKSHIFAGRFESQSRQGFRAFVLRLALFV